MKKNPKFFGNWYERKTRKSAQKISLVNAVFSFEDCNTFSRLFYDLLQKYMETAIAEDSVLRRQDSYAVMIYVSNNVYGREMAWRFVRDNWNSMDKIYSKSRMGRVLAYVTKRLSKASHLDELERFVEANQSSMRSIQSKVDEARLNVRFNVAWMAENKNVTLEWMRNRNKERAAAAKATRKIKIIDSKR